MRLTKHELSQLKHIQGEIDLLKKQIADIKPDYVMDSVVGSSPHFPYTAHSIKIEGLDMQDYDKRVKRLKNQLQRRHDDLLDKRAEIEEFINTIDDSLTRQIIALRYINDFPWQQIACSIGGGNTADGVRKQHDRFLGRT